MLSKAALGCVIMTKKNSQYFRLLLQRISLPFQLDLQSNPQAILTASSPASYLATLPTQVTLAFLV